jgi:hypothetical protein
MSRQNEVMFYTDGRHTSVYIYEPPMDKRLYTAPIDELVDLGIDTICYAVGDCRVLLYDTKVGERWGHNLQRTNHIIWYRAALNVEQFILAGNDPLQVVCERAQELGFGFIPSLLLGMQHQVPAVVNDCRCSDFCFDHPEYQVGPEPDRPESRWDDPTRFSYAIPEVRQNRLAVIEELVSAYDTDGIELNLYDYAPFLARHEIPEHTSTFTRFVADARRLCDAAAARQGRPKRLLVRVGASLAGCSSLGIDLQAMIGDQIVDTVVAMPPHSSGMMAQHPGGLAELIEAASGTGVRVIQGISTTVRHDAFAAAPRQMQAAQAAIGYRAGARGVFFSTYYPDGYPYADADLANLRFMGHPELLAHKDKHFAVRQGPNEVEDTPGDYSMPHPLPVALEQGKVGAEQRLSVSDDVIPAMEAGELSRCELRVRLMSLIHDDTFELWFNDVRISREQQQWQDWTYAVRPVPGKTPMVNNYWITVDLLRSGHLPRLGDNSVRVDLTRHDPRCDPAVQLHDVELLVQYRDHRHAPRRDEW